ncbi:MAG: flagellar biosynthesis protein FlgA [Frankiales bacterium]|nr:flagellar biosynthesis protein FlgA [Frankiales bacterium]
MQMHAAPPPASPRPLAGARLEVVLNYLAGWPRRLCAGLCLLLAVASFVIARRPAAKVPPAGPERAVVVANKDMGPGTEITAADVRLLSLPRSAMPVDVLTASRDAIGHRIGAPVARDEVLTKIRLLDTALTDDLPRGHVALSVHLADPAQTDLLRAGSDIDLYLGLDGSVGGGGELVNGQSVSPAAGGHAGRIATGVRVLAVLPDAGGDTGSALAVSVDSDTAARLAARPNGPYVATLRPPP